MSMFDRQKTGKHPTCLRHRCPEHMVEERELGMRKNGVRTGNESLISQGYPVLLASRLRVDGLDSRLA